MHDLLYVGIIILTGIVAGKLISYIKLPHITGYLLGGILIGPSVLNLVPHEGFADLRIISEIALGFIAYTIGCEFNISNLKKTGKGVIIITIFQALVAVVLVDIALIYILGENVGFSLVLGAIATATAPGPILMIVKQYRARGPLVNTLLPLVALDDALGIVIFGVCAAIAQSLMSSAELSMHTMIVVPFTEIGVSVLIGVALGGVLGIIIKNVTRHDILISCIAGVLFLGIGISNSVHASPILLCMIMGGTVSNLVPNIKNLKVLHKVENFTPPIYVAFFTLAGIELDVVSVMLVGKIGIVYIVVRMIGKIVGSYMGGVVAKSPTTVKRYLGYTLIPQAGVAIGLAMVAETILPAPYGSNVRTVVLAATVVYELIGPLMAKIAICKAGEAYQAPSYGEVELQENFEPL